MSEKTGHTIKLIYDFNTAASTEVQIDNVWYRATPREFRSFNYPRRIVDMGKTEIYEGPVYLFDTNHIVKTPAKTGLLCPNDVDPRTAISEARGRRGR